MSASEIAVVAPPPSRAASIGERARAHVWVAVALGLIAFAASWYRHADGGSRTYDLAVFEQAVWKLAQGRAPELSMVGWNAFADHLSPVLLLFAPLYRLAATPLWFFAAQAIAMAAGYLVMPALLDEMGVRGRARAAFLFAYLASPLLWNATMFDFHPTTLAVPLLLGAVVAALRGDGRALLLCSAGVLFSRDDLGPAVAAVALVGLRARPGALRARTRVAVAAAGVAWFLAGTALAAALGADRHWGFHYGAIAPSAAAAASSPLRTLARLAVALGRMANLRYLWSVFILPTGLLAMLAPSSILIASVLALPLLASGGPLARYPYFHYGAPLFPFLIYGAITGWARLRGRARTAGALSIAALSFVSLLTIGPLAAQQFFPKGPPRDDIRRAVSLVRPDDVVVATETIGPHLAHRDVLLPFPYPFAPVKLRYPLAAPVREISEARAREVDVVLAWRNESTIGRVLSSPLFSDFSLSAEVGEILVYRRARGT